MINIEVIKPDNKLELRYFKTAEHRINNEWKYYFFKNENNILEKIFDFIRDKWMKKEHEYLCNLIIFYSNLNDMKPQDLINFFYKKPSIFHPSFIIVKKKNEIFKPQNFENYNSIIRIIKEDNNNELVIYLNEITYFYNFLGDEIIFPINFMKESILEQNIQLITKHLLINYWGRKNCIHIFLKLLIKMLLNLFMNNFQCLFIFLQNYINMIIRVLNI